MPIFECRQCGKCCDFSKYPGGNMSFTLWEWEKTHMEKEAQYISATLDVRPRCGVLRGHKMIVWQYAIYHEEKCPFLQNNLCSIDERKPLMCALAPYPDNPFSDKNSWRCLDEKMRGLTPKRKMFMDDPHGYVSDRMAYTAQIVRILQMFGPITKSCDVTSFGVLKKYIKQKDGGIKKIETKPLFTELTRLELLDPGFLEIMSMYKISDIYSLRECIKKIKNEVGYHQITQADMESIFSHWEETAHEIVSIL